MTIAAIGRDASAIEVLERVITTGDLARLAPEERVALYARTAESLGLNPLTRPFEYITLNNRLVLYVRKDATDQLRRIYKVSIDALRREPDPETGLLTYIAEGHTPDGRRDQASGSVNIKGLSGEALANAAMKAETKAKRRLTLSLVGLGFLDESEVEGAERVSVDPETGEMVAPAAEPSLLDAAQAQLARLNATAMESGDALPAEPMTVEQSADLPALCGVEDTALDTGPCEQPTGHGGPHRNGGGVWPNRP